MTIWVNDKEFSNREDATKYLKERIKNNPVMNLYYGIKI